MTATTPIYALPYPEGTDEADAPDLAQDLAVALETEIQRLDTLIATLTGNQSAQATSLAAHVGSQTAHGISGQLVGTTDTQPLTNKTIDGNLNTLSVLQSQIIGAPAGGLVGVSAGQTLTNKVMSGASNTFSNIPQAAVVFTDTTSVAFVMSSGWTVGAVAVARKVLNRFVYIELRVTRSGGDIDGDLNGNISSGNSNVAVIPVGYRPTNQIGLTWTSDQTDGGGYITSAGQIIISSMNTGAQIATGHTVYFSLLYMV